jgi:hypothetical protein
MANVTFRNEADGSSFEMTASKAARVLDDIRDWATSNDFAEVVFWRDPQDTEKFWVQLGDQRLNYWVPESTFTEGQHEQVEAQMDFARGAQRRHMAGFDRFDK